MPELDERVRPETKPGDGSGHFTHIVWLPPELKDRTTPQAYVMNARINGIAIQALCGYVWVPSRDPEKLPICQVCKDIYESADRTDADGNSGLPDA